MASDNTPALNTEYQYMESEVKAKLASVRAHISGKPMEDYHRRFTRDCDIFLEDVSATSNPCTGDLMDLNDRFQSLMLISEKILNDDF